MKKYTKFLIATLLFFALSCCFGKTNAFALDVNSEIVLNALFSTGGDIKLTADITATKNIIANGDVNLDLNGHTLDLAGYTIVPYATLTINDSSEESAGKIKSTGAFAIQVGSSAEAGQLIVNGGTIEGNGSYGALRDMPLSTITINGGKITSAGYGIYDQGAPIIQNGGLIESTGDSCAVILSKPNSSYELNGGTVSAMYHVGNNNGNAVCAFKDTDVTINDGTVNAAGNAITGNGSISGSSEGTNASFTINGGIITSQAGVGIYAPQPNGITTILGGVITGISGVEIRAGTLNVAGGTIIGTADYQVTDNSNGVTTRGAAISVAQHTTKQPITVKITNGLMKASHPVSFTNPMNNPPEDIEKITIEISGGTYTGEDYTDVIKHIVENKSYYSQDGSIIIGEKPEEDIVVPNTGDNTPFAAQTTSFDFFTQFMTVSMVATLVSLPSICLFWTKKFAKSRE